MPTLGQPEAFIHARPGIFDRKLIAMNIRIIFVVFFLVFCLVNCKSVEKIVVSATKPARLTQQIEALSSWKQEFVVMPGQVSFIHFPYFGPFVHEELVCNDEKIPFSVKPQSQRAYAYVAPSYFAVGDKFVCEFHFNDSSDRMTAQKFSIGSISMRSYNYPRETLNVDQGKVVLSKENERLVAEENAMMKAIYTKSEASPLFEEEFAAPSSMITSIYGTKRIFNNQKSSQHLGTDYRAQIGTDVYASNRGRVVFTGPLFYGGNTVIIDHGMGIFSSYSHLSKIFVHIGDMVDKQTVLALSGMTGRVNGPHLHWGIRIHGNWVDGNSLVKASRENFSPQINEIITRTDVNR